MSIKDLVSKNYNLLIKGLKPATADKVVNTAKCICAAYEDDLSTLYDACIEDRLHTLALPKYINYTPYDNDGVADTIQLIINLNSNSDSNSNSNSTDESKILLDDQDALLTDDLVGDMLFTKEPPSADVIETTLDELVFSPTSEQSSDPILPKPIVSKPFTEDTPEQQPIQQPQQPVQQQQPQQQQINNDLLNIGSLVEKQAINHYAFCSKCEIKESKAARWLDLRLRDTDGKVISGRLFGYVGDFDGFAGKVVKVIGTVDNFKALYIAVKSISDEVTKYTSSDFVRTINDLKEYMESSMDLIAKVRTPEIKQFLETLFMKKKFLAHYANQGGGVSYHHVDKGALLKHSVNVTKMALYQAQISKLDVNYDVLIAGALLHDIGKLQELPPVGLMDYTTEGLLLGHLFMGANYVYNELNKTNLDKNLKLNIVHCIISHHGKPEFGNIMPPRTIEAILIHKADAMDAETDHFQQYQGAIGEKVTDPQKNIIFRM